MTRLIGKLCRWTGARLVCLGTHLHAFGCHLAPRKRVVVVVAPWAEPAAWTQAHVPGQTAPAPKDWN